ncbi:MAG TPA: non-ribosomal peptide synthetase, partial [Ktedonobacteraceae bacterium]|nr:non-ribosomal peptide synthetase [Ktedonobacteraceae bacterium]
VLEGIVADAQRSIAHLPLLTEEEERQLLVQWNETGSRYPEQCCVHQLFEEQVERTPEALAVVYEHERLTYAELNLRANRLAHRLQRSGVGPEVLVGVCMERSLELVVSLLAILKAGGAYVPFDPTYPAERLAFILQDTGVSLLLTQERLLNVLPEYSGKVICLDRCDTILCEESGENPTSAVLPENLIYIIYTSGSTGQPKGVQIEHRSVVRLVKATSYAALTAQEVFLQFAPVSFDASTLEIWGSLLNGSQLVIFPPHTPSLHELGEFLRAHHITTLWLTAGLFHQMVEHHLEGLRGIKQLLAGGDVLSIPHVHRVLHELEHCQLINGYGPTESTTFACCYSVPRDSRFSTSVPIGRPIANTQVYILDAHLQPVPIGVVGELYIGGVGLSRGYLNRPELTAERFVANPFSADASSRLYKTGDLARYLPDGTIEFLGRLDHQVKLRGYRIEPGEIEVALSDCSGVQEARVLVREDTPGDKRLVAYIVPSSHQSITGNELRASLKRRLPDYMVPSAFVLLETFPLTPNGKVDQRKLPVPEKASCQLKEHYVAPRNETEQQLATIWMEVLGRERVSISANFFEMGGHSLSATRVIARIRQVFQMDLPLSCLFQAPTIEDLALAMLEKQMELIDEETLALLLMESEMQ